MGAEDGEESSDDSRREGLDEPVSEVLVFLVSRARRAIAIEDTREEVESPLLALPGRVTGSIVRVQLLERERERSLHNLLHHFHPLQEERSRQLVLREMVLDECIHDLQNQSLDLERVVGLVRQEMEDALMEEREKSLHHMTKRSPVISCLVLVVLDQLVESKKSPLPVVGIRVGEVEGDLVQETRPLDREVMLHNHIHTPS